MRAFFWLVPALLQVQMLELPAVDKNPYTSEADVALGKKLFGGRCAGCHGPTGDGGKGANLAVPQLPRASTELALYRIVRYGIPDTEMPGTLLTPREVWQLSAFVRSLGRIERGALVGDAARGKQLVSGKAGCLKCHTIGAEGGGYGPALTDAGSRRSPGYLRAKMLDPSPEAISDFRVVQLETRDGRKLSGIRLNEDTFSIQMRDLQNNLHSFRKDQLSEWKVERRTLMPSYKNRLSETELNDIVAYLAGLRGAE